MFAIVETKRLFINVTKQVEGFNADVSTTQATFQEAPEVFQTVGVDVAINIGREMVNHLVLKTLIHAPLFSPFVRHDLCSLLHVSGDLRLYGTLLSVVQNAGPNAFLLAMRCTLKDAEHDALIAKYTVFLSANPAALVHIANLTADETFIDLDFAVEIASGKVILQCQAYATQHKPCGFLGDAEIAANFETADAVLAVGKQPNGREPLVQTERRVFKDSSKFDGELPFFVFDRAHPNLTLRVVVRVLSATGGAYDNTVRPAPRYQVFQAIVGVLEVDDRFLKSGGFVAHKPMLTGEKG